MKKILTLLLIVISTSVYSQNINLFNKNKKTTIEYPLITKDSIGNDIVILTLEQMRHIDNQLDILELMKESGVISNRIDTVYLEVINDKDSIIAKQDVMINKMGVLLENKSEQIENLKIQINLYMSSENIILENLKNKDEEIKIHIDRIEKLENENKISKFTFGAILSTLLAFLLIK